MTSTDPLVHERACLPSLAVYNTRFLSLSHSEQEQRKRKIENVKSLTDRCDVVGILETHVDGTTAEAFFCNNFQGTRRFYDQNLALVVNDKWYQRYRPDFVVIIPSVMVALTWEQEGRRHWAVFFRLDAHTERARIDQLRTAIEWARENVGPRDWASFLGDRNFVKHASERQSSSVRVWRPSPRMNETWDRWLKALGAAAEIAQPEFTWGRVLDTDADSTNVAWVYEVLDVAGTNDNGHANTDLWPMSRRCDYVPYPAASDHWPLELRWTERRRRKRPAASESLVKRPIPKWLLKNARFLTELDFWFDAWFLGRARGLDAVESFVDEVYKFSTDFMRTNIIQAETPEHKLDTTLAVTRLLRGESLDEARLGRLLSVHPELKQIVVLDVDAANPGRTSVSEEVFEQLKGHCRALASEIVAERASNPDATPPDAESQPPAGSLKGRSSDSSMVTRLKALKQGKRLSVESVWDESSNAYVSDVGGMADVFVRAARERQGVDAADPQAGTELLEDWAADFSMCRTRPSRNEVETIIRDSPTGKRPGPDGVPSEVFRRFANQLAEVFLEVWDELAHDDFDDRMFRVLGLKTWMLLPKMEGANRVDKFRDLELGNESRKIVARMLNGVLDEVCARQGTGLSAAQQAFVKGRDIVRNTFEMLRVFWDSVDTGASHEDPLLMLLLDCSKGYNRMSRQWVRKVLEKAGLPRGLIKLVDNLMVSISVLMINGEEHAPLELLTGLTQGCPASCFLFIIAVDPLLQALSKLDGVKLVSGFVDDWSVACVSFAALARVSALVAAFETATGQRINKDKSSVVPARRLSSGEIRRCYDAWGWELKISYCERLLGVYIGLAAGIEEQYKDAMEKFEKSLQVFNDARDGLGIVAGIVVVNVFLYSLFSYQNRLFFMPGRLVKEVERRVLNFLTPVSWSKLGLFTSIRQLYGISCGMVDLRSANVSAVLATHERIHELKRGVVESLSRWRRGGSKIQHPAISWYVSLDYYRHAAGRMYGDTLQDARQRRGSRTAINEYRALCNVLLGIEASKWRTYLAARVRAKGWDVQVFMRELRCLPRSMPQGHRWFLLKVHLNAPMMTSRVAAAGVSDVEACAFCGLDSGDRWQHVTRCGLVMSVCDQLFATGRMPVISDAYPFLMLQVEQDGASLAATVAAFAAIWKIRAACRATRSDVTQRNLFEMVVRALDCPWLVGCVPSRDKGERRRSRVRAPLLAPERVIYRSDGASRGQGRDGAGQAGWGSAAWQSTSEGYGSGPPTATAHGHLGDGVSNNIAEYVGLRECMRRACRVLDPVVFQVDSGLVAHQMARHDAWACRSDDLVPLRDACRALGGRLSNAAVAWEVRHIYREFNQTADSLANRGVEDSSSFVSSELW